MLVGANVSRSVGSVLEDWLDEVKSAVAVAAVNMMLVKVLRLCGVGSLAVFVVVVLQVLMLLRL